MYDFVLQCDISNFDEAYEAYKGGEFIVPGKYQRRFDRLRWEIEVLISYYLFSTGIDSHSVNRPLLKRLGARVYARDCGIVPGTNDITNSQALITWRMKETLAN